MVFHENAAKGTLNTKLLLQPTFSFDFDVLLDFYMYKHKKA